MFFLNLWNTFKVKSQTDVLPAYGFSRTPCFAPLSKYVDAHANEMKCKCRI